MPLWISRVKLFGESLIVGLFVITVFPPFLILRILVNKLSKWLRRDLDCMVRPRDALFCQDYQLWHIEPGRTVLCSNILDSGVTLEQIYCRYEKAVWKSGNLKLHQSVEKWMGYLFWKNDQDFQLENHINLFEDDQINSDEQVRDEKWLTKLKQKLLRKPYLKNKSPWEILLVPNFKSDIDPTREFCVIIWRLHHVLGDGISLRNITMELLDEAPQTIEPQFKSSTPRGLLNRVGEGFLFFVKAPYTLLKTIEDSNDRNKSPWNSGNFKFRNISSSAKSRQISLQYLKDIKNKFSVSLNSVILLGVSSIIRRAFIKAKIDLPDLVHCAFPLPLPNHPDELCYHATGVFFGFPIGTADPAERLKIIDKSLSDLKNSLVPYVVYLYGSIVGRLPFEFQTKPGQFFLTGCVTIFPGAIERRPMLGRNYYSESFCLSAHNPISSSGFFITCLTNYNILDIDSHFDRSIFSLDSEIEELYESLYEDYRKMSSSDMFTRSEPQTDNNIKTAITST